MKILHLTTHLNAGGITRYCLSLGKRLSEEGHEVAVLSSGGDLTPDFKTAGIRVFELPLKAKNILSPRLWKNYAAVSDLVKNEGFDLIHAHTRVTQFLAAVVCLRRGIPMVTTAHGFFKRNFGRKVLPCWGKRVIAISSTVAEDLKRTHRVKPSQVRVIFNAIDIDDHRRQLAEYNPSEIRRMLGIQEGTFVIGCVARLVEDKGQAYLVEAVAGFQKKYPGCHLILVGDGRERKNLEKLIQKKKLTKNVTLVTESVDPTPYYAVMDVFVHPATTREGFGLVILEAMASKVPVVATDVPAVNTIIRDHINGFLVPAQNAKGIEKALVEVRENPDTAGEIAENAFSLASQNYSMDRMVREMETVYREALGKK